MISWTQIQHIALQVGFDAIGCAAARRLDYDADFMQQWIEKGFAGKMDYLTRNGDKRYDIRLLVEGAKTVVVGLLSYEHSGKDYHRTVKSKLYALKAALLEQKLIEDKWVGQHIFCDSAPVLERRWAVEAGLGWIGKNHQLIHPTLGSRVHPGELVLLDEVEGYSFEPIENRCGACQQCVEHCPNNALLGEWDARKCVAYNTFRCEVCQQYCPWNKKESL